MFAALEPQSEDGQGIIFVSAALLLDVRTGWIQHLFE